MTQQEISRLGPLAIGPRLRRTLLGRLLELVNELTACHDPERRVEMITRFTAIRGLLAADQGIADEVTAEAVRQ